MHRSPGPATNVTSCSNPPLASSLKSLLSHSCRLLLELRPVLFVPLHSVQMCVRVCVEVRVRVEEMALSSCASGRPLAELSSLASTGNTAQLQGNHSAGNLRFHLSPIHSGTYLERRGGRCACHEPEGRARLVFWTGGSRVGRPQQVTCSG